MRFERTTPINTPTMASNIIDADTKLETAVTVTFIDRNSIAAMPKNKPVSRKDKNFVRSKFIPALLATVIFEPIACIFRPRTV